MTSIQLHSSVHGAADAPVLLLLNSLGATEAMWEAQIPLLSGHYRVITCDTRGHGQSPAPEGPYAFSDFVDDALAVLDAHGVEKASVLGLSLGGMTALGLGLNHPDRIERIVCCAARSDAPEPFVQSWHTRLAKLDEGGVEAVWNGTVGFWLSEETRAAHPEREAALRDGFLRTSPTGYRGCAHALMELDYLRHLGKMTVPALFVSGENDGGASPATMEEMAAACPGSQYACVSGAKHVINVDRPQDFALAIGGFLELDTE
ncbi:alpha/beta fold hydrolase [Pseudooceanicola algae]|uniref:3-oxoadipate enol-lactonase 2 n=1 Tax=Pseudooceanicola algae TaxID=1537215 RepID=A0A418SHE1_9RHOB|nr:alpha/beta fold hydrolase [Pseudooceanicola algae]QPM90468.1 3-oxoadipate enol-lactonase 2 [Pseudooceanicola algae]